MSTSLSRTSPSSLKKRLLSGGAWAFGGKVVTAITVAAVNALLTRLLAPEEMGAYFLTFSLVSVAAILGQIGMDQTVVRLVAESLGTDKPRRARAAVRTVFLYGGLGTLVVAGILALGTGQWLARQAFDSPLLEGVIGLAVAWVVVIACQSLLAETFRGFHDIRLATLFGGLVKGVLSVILFAFLWRLQGHADLGQVLSLSIVAGGTSALIAGLLLRRKVSSLEGGGQIQDREVLAIAWPLLTTNLVLLAFAQTDVWILSAFHPLDEVAIYGAAAHLVVLVSMSLSIVNAVMPPSIAEMYAQGKKRELEHVLRTVATLSGIPAFVGSVGFILLGAPILGLVFGDYYRQGAMVLALLSVGNLVNVWTGSCGLSLRMTGHQVTMMKIAICRGFFTAAGALWLVRDYGAVGVASTTALSSILLNILTLFLVRKKIGIWTHARFALPSIRQIF
jgi:O-antigen/teichoic acid export membrane protein